jgi:hypothetical protein
MKLNLNNFGKKFKLNKRAKKDKIVSEEEMFVETIDMMSKCWERSNKLYDVFKINFLEYEEEYFRIMENFVVLKYGLWKAEIILWYVFGRVDMDGKVHALILQNDESDEPQDIALTTTQELWDFLKKLEEEKNK